jgi:hypothetical protein
MAGSTLSRMSEHQEPLFDFSDEARRIPIPRCGWYAPCKIAGEYQSLLAINGPPHLVLLCANHDQQLQGMRKLFERATPLDMELLPTIFPQVSGPTIEETPEEPARALEAAVEEVTPEAAETIEPPAPEVPPAVVQAIPQVPFAAGHAHASQTATAALAESEAIHQWQRPLFRAEPLGPPPSPGHVFCGLCTNPRWIKRSSAAMHTKDAHPEIPNMYSQPWGPEYEHRCRVHAVCLEKGATFFDPDIRDGHEVRVTIIPKIVQEDDARIPAASR